MEFRLFLDKVKLALTKRVVKKKQKCYADWAAKGYMMNLNGVYDL